MHAILFGRKIYALDMPSNFIFTHRRWLGGEGEGGGAVGGIDVSGQRFNDFDRQLP